MGRCMTTERDGRAGRDTARVAEVTTPATRAEALHLTGERTVPGIAEENYWFRRHEAAYAALLPLCDGATVLEAGCGEGWGAGLIAPVATRVLARDYDVVPAEHVARRYA